MLYLHFTLSSRIHRLFYGWRYIDLPLWVIYLNEQAVGRLPKYAEEFIELKRINC